MSNQKKLLFYTITFFLSLATVEVGLRAVLYQLNTNELALHKVWSGIQKLGETQPPEDQLVIDMDEVTVDALRSIGGLVENANNPTKVKKHQGPLTQLDSTLGYRLRPNVLISNHMIAPKTAGNIDPPVVAYPSNAKLPQTLSKWLDQNSRLTYVYSTDDNGRRLTLPRVVSDRKIVIVGDSVAFGVGVRDEQTVASHLQSIVAKSNIQVINLGVGGYDANQAFEMAAQESHNASQAALVYVACQNDFMKDGKFDISGMETTIEKFIHLKQSANYQRLVIVLQSYIEFSFHHLLNKWPQSRIDKMREGFIIFDGISKKSPYEAVNWDSVVNRYNIKHGSLFSGLSLYVDHVHLSNEGNRIMAKEIAKALGLYSEPL
jgi:lysophospholipase L1-like esterase